MRSVFARWILVVSICKKRRLGWGWLICRDARHSWAILGAPEAAGIQRIGCNERGRLGVPAYRAGSFTSWVFSAGSPFHTLSSPSGSKRTCFRSPLPEVSQAKQCLFISTAKKGIYYILLSLPQKKDNLAPTPIV